MDESELDESRVGRKQGWTKTGWTKTGWTKMNWTKTGSTDIHHPCPKETSGKSAPDVGVTSWPHFLLSPASPSF